MNNSFEQTAVQYFSDPDKVGLGLVQRIDGIECFSPLPKFWFWRLRLWMLWRKGVLARKTTRSIWASCNGMPAYGLSTKYDSMQVNC